jgi:hypothetical protein
MYPSYSIYPREGHLWLHRWLLQFRSSCSNRRCHPQHGNLRQFFSTQSIRRSCQIERVKWWTQHDRTLQRALSPTPEGKDAWEAVKILFSTILIFSDLHDQCIIPRFLVLPFPFRKSWDKISFRGGGGCNTPCYAFFLIIFLISFIKHQVPWLIKSLRFEIKIQSQKFKFEVLSYV